VPIVSKAGEIVEIENCQWKEENGNVFWEIQYKIRDGERFKGYLELVYIHRNWQGNVLENLEVLGNLENLKTLEMTGQVERLDIAEIIFENTSHGFFTKLAVSRNYKCCPIGEYGLLLWNENGVLWKKTVNFNNYSVSPYYPKGDGGIDYIFKQTDQGWEMERIILYIANEGDVPVALYKAHVKVNSSEIKSFEVKQILLPKQVAEVVLEGPIEISKSADSLLIEFCDSTGGLTALFGGKLFPPSKRA
jgi:hypothetical protein